MKFHAKNTAVGVMLLAQFLWPEAQCAASPPAVIVVDEANGYAKPSQRPKVTRTLHKLNRVEITKQHNNAAEGRIYFQVEGTHGQPASRRTRPLPPAWIESRDVVFTPAMKEWSGCWPFEDITFVDGVVDVRVVLDRNGIGKISYTEGPIDVPARIYSAGDVVDIRDMDQQASYLFILSTSPKTQISTQDHEVVKSAARPCRSSD